MTQQYRVILKGEVLQQLAALERAAKSQPSGLRDREFRALKAGLRAVATGDEAAFDGKRLGYSPNHHDLRDLAEIKLPVVNEMKYDRELGPSHRLLYREFEPEDSGLPVREVVCFEPRANDRPFDVAAARLGRQRGVKLESLQGAPDTRPTNGARPPGQASPVRQPLPPDLRKALAAASDVAPARGAVTAQPSTQNPSTTQHRGDPPSRER